MQASVGSSVVWSLQLEYDVVGRESLRRLLGGVESQTRYDRSGRVTDQVTKGTGYEVSHRSYEWGLSGKLRRLTAGKYMAEFDYDVVGTLAAARYDETEILYKLPDRKNIIHLPTSSTIDPTRTVHTGRHTSNYDKMILSRLDEIEALDADDIIKRMHVNDLMEKTEDDLRGNRIRLNNH